MDRAIETPLTRLEPESLLRIDGGRGRRIVVFSGRVWVTQEGDRRDLVLEAGDEWQIERPGCTLVQALQRSTLLLLETPAQRLATGDSLARLLDARRQRSAAFWQLLRRLFAFGRRPVASSAGSRCATC